LVKCIKFYPSYQPIMSSLFFLITKEKQNKTSSP